MFRPDSALLANCSGQTSNGEGKVVQRGTIRPPFYPEVLRGLGGQNTVWSRKDETPFPNLNTDPYVLCPEGSVTKKF